MDDELSENAALHVLGLLTGDAKTAFEEKLSADPALRQEWRAMQEAALALAKGAPRHAPPAELRGQILAAFSRTALTDPESSPASTPLAREISAVPETYKPARLLRFVPWAAAAALVVLLYQKDGEAAARGQEVANLKRANAELSERDRQQRDAVHAAVTANQETAAALETTRVDLRKMEERATALEQEKSLVATELETLRRDSQLDRTRIAVLKSMVKTQSKALAVSVWRQESQEGVLVVENLPAIPSGRDYQLWILDPNHPTPISAGVFKVDANGKMRLEFKPALPVLDPSKFAVTEEKEGGSPTPHLDKLMVISG